MPERKWDYLRKRTGKYVRTNFGLFVIIFRVDGYEIRCPRLMMNFEVIYDIRYYDPVNLAWGKLVPGIYRLARNDEEIAFNFLRFEKLENGEWTTFGWCEIKATGGTMFDWRGTRLPLETQLVFNFTSV